MPDRHIIFVTGAAEPIPVTGDDRRYTIQEPKMSKPLQPFSLAEALAGALVQLRDGSTARVVHHNPDARRDSTVLGYTADNYLITWGTDGCYISGRQHSKDIIGMAPRTETREGWVNVYPETDRTMVYLSQADAEHYAHPSRIACVKVTYTFEV